MLEQGHHEECGEQLGTKDWRLEQVHCLRPLGLVNYLFMEMSRQSCNAQPCVVLVVGGGFSDVLKI